jgi:cation diffusion facilitator CzcD-associated flavoprotein CzcO
VVIGSGATAVTLVPALAERGAQVTMLQRSPSWVMSLPRGDRVRELAYAALPQRAAAALVRWKNVLLNLGLYQLTRRRPRLARRILLAGAARALGDAALVSPHFTPNYDPWDQRLCVVPDGDLFEVVRSGRAEVVTDTIERFTPGGIRLASGRELAADVIVTATGLRLKAAGGIELSVDGEPLALGDRVVYRGTMLGGVPNLALSVGYINSSWTLRSDLAARYVCRLLNHLDEGGWRVAVPGSPTAGERRALLPLTSGYIQRAASELPQQGETAPWVMRQNYVLDRRDMLHGDVTEAMSFRH